MTKTLHSMTRRDFCASTLLSAGTMLGAGSLLNACGNSASGTGSKTVALTAASWFGPDRGKVRTTNLQDIIASFQKKHPGVTIKWNTFSDYDTIIRTRVAAGNVPDLIALRPGTSMYPFIQANTAVDLSNQPWTQNIVASTKEISSYRGKVYGLPLGESVIGTVYNKEIFARLHLEVPTSWDDFLHVCQKIKSAGIIPLALGNKDQWVDQLIPYAMAPSAIFRETPDFDVQMLAGKRTFAGSSWKQMMQDYVALSKQGFVNEGALGTTYDQSAQLVARGKAAMVVNGDWIVSPIQAANPKIQLGMFPFPYTQKGKAPWVASSLSGLLGVSAKSAYQKESLAFLQYWAQPENMSEYLTLQGYYSSLTNIQTKVSGPSKDMIEPLKAGSYNFLDAHWPDGVQTVMLKDIQSVFAGSLSIDQMLTDMDQAYQSNKSKIA
ncbi:hypothetical protein KDA_54950 [Dictyobacter alpinus]|uniref:Sugar ABC transporter substrate-binding protein n=1 Tax=Dictyobacter alpinus TaxID=2014873 RepID=A0A402BF01_9CHLR|nr:extracellular solute-binding protein [Dictyobacter alpinus]GCE30011.1 hypothetical protein KDA_54950 [Dictyobacter alpinus]